MMKNYLFLLTVFFSFNVFGQKELDTYKYVVVPSRFDCQKTANEYGLNMLLKYKFQQLGFEVYLDTDDLPEKLRVNSCLYVVPNLISKSTMFKTTVKVELKDCAKKSLYLTKQGSSSAKNYKLSYNEATREALKSFNGYELSYTPKQEVNTTTVSELEIKNKITEYLLDSIKYKITILEGVFYAEIVENITNRVIGKISKTSKKGIYHVLLNGKNCIGYYDETNSFIVEFLHENGNIILHKFQKIG